MKQIEIWELLNKHGLSIIPDINDDTITLTITHSKKGSNKIDSCISFARKAEPGLLIFLPDRDWKQIAGVK
jgi:hypothetical protein